MTPLKEFDGAATRPAFMDGLSGATLDELFRRSAMRTPTRYALIDAPNRGAFSNQNTRYLSYATADRAVSAIAGRLHHIGLPRNSVVALQMPNVTEAVLALLGVMRAGMIAAPLPLLWRRADIVEALGSVGAKAIIAGGRIADDDLRKVSLDVGAHLFSVRYVCGFGQGLPDGMIGLDRMLAAERLDPIPRMARGENPAANLAVITWDTNFAKRGPRYIPVARSHAQLTAGGLAILLESGINEGTRILAAQSFHSFSGLASTVLPWLLSGGTLHLHHGFEPDVFTEQCAAGDCDTVVLPGPLVAPLNQAAMLSRRSLRRVLAVWRTPERLAASPAWRNASADLMDVQAFGEVGIICGRREMTGQPKVYSVGPIALPRGDADAAVSLDVSLSEAGTLKLRGPMVPLSVAGMVGEGCSALQADAAGYVDTGYPCRIDRDSRTITVSGPPAGLINIGGYSFVPNALAEVVGQTGYDTTIAALPDACLGHRLAGRARDRDAVRSKLAADGANVLVVNAFRERRSHAA